MLKGFMNRRRPRTNVCLCTLAIHAPYRRRARLLVEDVPWTDTGLATMAEAAKQRMQEFAPEKTVASLLSYYSEVLHANGYDRHQDQKSSPK
jgi:hypothetical protein